jgi:hypothetical protein
MRKTVNCILRKYLKFSWYEFFDSIYRSCIVALCLNALCVPTAAFSQSIQPLDFDLEDEVLAPIPGSQQGSALLPPPGLVLRLSPLAESPPDSSHRLTTVWKHPLSELPISDEDRMEITFQLLNAIDAVQTSRCLSSGRCRELNPVLGSRPGTGRLVATKAATGLVHLGITRLLSSEMPEAVDAWQYASVTIQGSAVLWNMSQSF